MSHSYYDPDYIFSILEKEGLLLKEQISKLIPWLAIPKRGNRSHPPVATVHISSQ